MTILIQKTLGIILRLIGVKDWSARNVFVQLAFLLAQSSTSFLYPRADTFLPGIPSPQSTSDFSITMMGCSYHTDRFPPQALAVSLVIF